MVIRVIDAQVRNVFRENLSCLRVRVSHAKTTVENHKKELDEIEM